MMQVWDDHDDMAAFENRLREVKRTIARQRHRRRRARFLRDFLIAGASFVLVLGITVLTAKSEELHGRLHVIDGDTVWHYGCARGEGCKPEKIRLLDIDAPESFRATCEGELVAGLRAKARLVELLAARPVRIERCDEHGDRCEDRFGRTLARLHTPAGEVGSILMREGLALKYEPGRKAERTARWCGG